jgi:hypothetical protein
MNYERKGPALTPALSRENVLWNGKNDRLEACPTLPAKEMVATTGFSSVVEHTVHENIMKMPGGEEYQRRTDAKGGAGGPLPAASVVNGQLAGDRTTARTE